MKNKFILASSAIALSMLLAAPVSADTDKRGDDKSHWGIKSFLNVNLHGSLSHDRDHNEENEHKAEKEKSEWKHEQKSERKYHRFDFASTTFGVITAINGLVFTVNPMHAGATTTVSTDSSTVFKVNGETATSGALTVGSRVAIVGTTTATSTSGNIVTASFVSIFNNFGKHFGFLKHWMNR